MAVILYIQIYVYIQSWYRRIKTRGKFESSKVLNDFRRSCLVASWFIRKSQFEQKRKRERAIENEREREREREVRG